MQHPRQVNLVMCWHMHQPDYRNHLTGDFVLPWTYLHAIKDYTDMAWHLEQHQEARAVFNFVPVLLDQIEAYVDGYARGQVPDPLLRLLIKSDFTQLTTDERQLILDSCFRCNHATMIEPFLPYSRLYELFRTLDQQSHGRLMYLSGQFFSDLLVWYHLVWTGETIRRENPLVIELMSKGENFSLEDRTSLYDLIGQVLGSIIPRYRKLSQQGRIELSTTPYHHPISPLLIDLNAAREAVPDMPLPDAHVYPGGRSRVSRHVMSAIESHSRRFGAPPDGMWPAEGGVSDGFLDVLAGVGISWAATGETVLANSIRKSGQEGALADRMRYLYRPYRVGKKNAAMSVFFRDDRLSDAIGFEYAKWHGRDAVNHLLGELKTILHHTPADEMPIVSIIMDGENAWEYYPYNGFYFLSGLYEALASDPEVRLMTFSEYLGQCGTQKGQQCAYAGELPSLVAGSWVYGTFSTWIGERDKNRAWDLLCAAKQSFDLMVASRRLSQSEIDAAEAQLSICESSDWFWWFGDYNPGLSVKSFDQLFRQNLANLYSLLKLPVPEQLHDPISFGGGFAEAGGTMRRGS